MILSFSDFEFVPYDTFEKRTDGLCTCIFDTLILPKKSTREKKKRGISS